MTTGFWFPRGRWSTSPLKLFQGNRVQVQHADGDWTNGTLQVFPGGLEIVFDEPRRLGECLESSRLLDRRGATSLQAVFRPETHGSEEVRAERDNLVWRAAHPTWPTRLSRWARELFHRDPVAAEPLLKRYLGRSILVEMKQGSRTSYASGLLLAYDAEFVAIADTVLALRNRRRLSPGLSSDSGLEILWNDEGIELFNRGTSSVKILGIRTTDGLRPWELELGPGRRERVPHRQIPPSGAEIEFERSVKGDVVLARDAIRLRGGAEGSVTIPALASPAQKASGVQSRELETSSPPPRGGSPHAERGQVSAGPGESHAARKREAPELTEPARVGSGREERAGEALGVPSKPMPVFARREESRQSGPRPAREATKEASPPESERVASSAGPSSAIESGRPSSGRSPLAASTRTEGPPKAPSVLSGPAAPVRPGQEALEAGGLPMSSHPKITREASGSEPTGSRPQMAEIPPPAPIRSRPSEPSFSTGTAPAAPELRHGEPPRAEPSAASEEQPRETSDSESPQRDPELQFTFARRRD